MTALAVGQRVITFDDTLGLLEWSVYQIPDDTAIVVLRPTRETALMVGDDWPQCFAPAEILETLT
jgi:hypothetical protein